MGRKRDSSLRKGCFLFCFVILCFNFQSYFWNKNLDSIERNLMYSFSIIFLQRLGFTSIKKHALEKTKQFDRFLFSAYFLVNYCMLKRALSNTVTSHTNIILFIYLEGDGISRSLIRSKTLTELILKPCGEFRWSLEGSISQIHSSHLHVGAPGIFSDFLRFVQMQKRVGCGK